MLALCSLLSGAGRVPFGLSLSASSSLSSLRGVAAYHLFTGPDWPVREGTSFQETRDPVLLVSGKVVAHTRDTMRQTDKDKIEREK